MFRRLFNLNLNIGKFGKDVILNFFASCVLVATLQLIIYPYLSRVFDKDIFGFILSIMGVVNTIALTFGSALDNTRLITYRDYKEKTNHGDFNIILKYSSLINIFITTAVIFLLTDKINIIDVTLLVSVTLLTMLRAYLSVEYRLKINYLFILLYNVSVSGGYIIGALIASGTGAWQLTFLCGEICAVVFALFTTDFVKVRGKQRTSLFGGTLKGFINIAISTMIANLLIYLDRFIIYPFMGGENVAIFFAASMFGKIISMVFQPAAGVILTHLAQSKHKMKLCDFWKFNLALVVLSGIFYIFSIFLSPIVTAILYPDIIHYAKKYLYLANLAAIIATMGALTQPVLLKFCPTRWQVVLQAVFGITYFLSGVILLNLYGLQGFCAAALLSSALRLVLMWIVGSSSLKADALNMSGALYIKNGALFMLKEKILNKTAVLGVIGLGYVGLPLAVEKAKSGYKVIGFDIQKEKTDLVNKGINYIGDVVNEDLNAIVQSGKLTATTDFSTISRLDCVSICVPTPLDKNQQPDISYVKSSAETVAKYLHKDMLVVLESTTYPGTTEELVKPILESSGLKCGIDFYLAFSPERVDPGNLLYKTKNTPKVVGGVTPQCTEIAASLYEKVLEAPVFHASSPAVAEMEKILENIYRNINIGLINELAILSNKMGINIWEVIEAAKTKPYGFQAFYPGPGLGGHCIPLDPYYLAWKAREYGFHTSMIESSMMINDRMPEYCVQRAAGLLNRRFKMALNGSDVLLLGVAYKQDIDDYRESPALKVMEHLEAEGAHVLFYDPWVSEIKEKNRIRMGIPKLTEDILRAVDLVIVTTGHTNVDYDFVQRNSKIIFDTKNVMKNLKSRENIELL